MPKPSSGSSLDTGHALYSSLLHAWGLLEGSGSSSVDSRNGNTLTLGTGATWTTNGSGEAVLVFAGTGATVSPLASTVTLANGTNWSVAWAAKQTTTGNQGVLFANTTSGLLYQSATNFRYRSTTPADANFSGASPFTTTANYVLSYDSEANQVSLYKNGTLISTLTAPSGNLVATHIGSQGTTTSFRLLGQLEYLYVWSGRALNSTEAGTLNTDPYVVFVSAPTDSISLSEPSGVKCYQRNGSGQHTITVSGTYTGAPANIEYRFAGGSWATLAASPTGGSFSGSAVLATGHGTIDVRFSNSTGVTASSSAVTVGDVFVVAGQSNAEGRATNAQSKTTGSYTLSSFRADDAWRVNNDDPTDTGTSNGSIWPKLAEHIEADQSVPVILITTATGGTALVGSVWLPPSGTQYTNMVQQVTDSGVNAVKAILWYQGESDVLNGVTKTQYKDALEDFAAAAAADLPGSPKACALQIGYEGAAIDDVRTAIRELWDAGGNVFGGPSLYDQTKLLHPATDTLIQTTANRYWAALKETLYSGTSGTGRGPKLQSILLTDANTKIDVKFSRVLKTGLTFATAAWTVTDSLGAVSVSSVAYHATDTSAVTLTLATAAVGTTLVSLGKGITATGLVVPLGEDYTLPGSAGTINLPAENFVDQGISNPVSIPVLMNHYRQQGLCI